MAFVQTKAIFYFKLMSVFSAFNFKGLRALVRVDFNVPLDKQHFTIRDDNRIRAALPTIQKILADGGSVVLMSHLGRPKNGPEEKSSLKHLVAHLSELVKPAAVKFTPNCIGTEAMQAANALQPGEVLLLENLRFHPQEEEGDLDFAKQLSALGDVYVNDAFGTAHRAHASTAVIAQFFATDKKMFGLLMEAEVLAAEKVLHHAEKPFTAIVGGAKVSDKIMILENLLERASDIIIGGGMAYTFMKAQGGNIGSSLCETDKLDVAKDLLSKASAKGVRLHLPSDSVIADQFDAGANTAIAPSNDIPEGWMGLDIGPNACADFTAVLQRSRTILWNGPMGVFEMEKFRKGTLSIAEAVADATSKGAYSLVGGGDSVAAVNQFGYADKVSYVSTGGGAMLEFFEGKQLPGIAAIAR